MRPVHGAGSRPHGGGARPAVFIDKDGTLIDDVPYNVDPQQLRFTRHALPALQLLAREGFALVVVSNQPGLGLGRFTADEFARLQHALQALLRSRAGVELTGFHVCPHPPHEDGTPACLCRKPAPGLLQHAARAHRLDLAASWMVGDILDDVEAGRRAGCRSVLLDVGNETLWRSAPLRVPHRRCADLLQAAEHIVAARDGAAAHGGIADRLVAPPAEHAA